MRSVRVLALAACFAAATAFVGWWTVTVIAGAYALARRHSLAPREAMLAALVAWIALFARQMTQPSFATLLDQLQVGCVQVLPVIQEHEVKAALQGADHFAGRPMHKRDLV